jgi:NAD+ kinase
VTRSVLVVAHTGRAVITDAARHAIHRLQDAGVHVRALAEEVSDLGLTGIELCDGGSGSAADAELVLVLGGDGSILRAAELARAASVPLLGRQPRARRLPGRGRVGGPRPDARPRPGPRLHRRGAPHPRRERRRGRAGRRHAVGAQRVQRREGRPRAMLELVVEVDGRPLSRWGATGWSRRPRRARRRTVLGRRSRRLADGGGAARRPHQRARAVRPAHVAAPDSVVAFEVLPSGRRRSSRATAAGRAASRTGRASRSAAVTTRCCCPDAGQAVHRHARAKFHLPVEGWRGAREP